MSANIGMTLIACGLVAYAGGVPSFTWQNGGFVNAIVDTAAGIATITLAASANVDLLQAYIKVSALVAAIDLNCNVIQTNDTTVVVRGWTGGGVAADNDFFISVYERELR